jgi:hypothetical protein
LHRIFCHFFLFHDNAEIVVSLRKLRVKLQRPLEFVERLIEELFFEESLAEPVMDFRVEGIDICCRLEVLDCLGGLAFRISSKPML